MHNLFYQSRIDLFWYFCVVFGALFFLGVMVVASIVSAAPGTVAHEPIPNSRVAYVDTPDGLARCYYSNLTANYMGCVRLP